MFHGIIPIILLVLAAVCGVLGLLGAAWPRVFSLSGEGRHRESRALGFLLWGMVCFNFISIATMVETQARFGWNWMTGALTVWTAGVFAFGMAVLHKAMKPDFASPVERMIFEVKRKFKDSTPAERRAAMAELRRRALADLAYLEMKVSREAPEDWQEKKLRIAVMRSEWEEAPEKYPDEFPPKLRP